MSNTNATDHIHSLEKTKTAINTIKERLQPVIDKVNEDDFVVYSAQAHATVALSIGMLKYMAARLQGKDQGRKADDPLRAELNNMKRVLAEIKKNTALKVNKARSDKSQTASEQTKSEDDDSTPKETKATRSSPNTNSSIPTPTKQISGVNSESDTITNKKKRKSSDFKERGRNKSPKSRKKR